MLIVFPVIASSCLPPLQYPTIPKFCRYYSYQILKIPSETCNVFLYNLKILELNPISYKGQYLMLKDFHCSLNQMDFVSNYLLIDHFM